MGRMGVGFRGRRFSSSWMRVCAGWGRIMWTFTRFIGGMTTLRLRRRWRRCMMWGWQFCKALYLADLHGWTRFVTMQNHYNLLYREEEREMMRLCVAEGIGVLPWSPLARGRLTRAWQEGSTKRSESDKFARHIYTAADEMDRKVVDRLGEVAERKGI